MPTTFVARDSIGGQLRPPAVGRRAGQRPGSPAADGLLWAAELAAQLVGLLLPALPVQPAPSPAQVWPEVDRLVRLLAATSDGPIISRTRSG